jgi:hypothetical protein
MNRIAVLLHIRSELDARHAHYAAEIAQIDEALARETKSSAGDKYETSREMMTQTKTILVRNLVEVERGIAAVGRMQSQMEGPIQESNSGSRDSANRRVSFGSLLETNQGFFLIGMSLGETMTPEGVCITHCSMASPLGLALRGKEEGESVPWRKTSIQIIKLFD